MSSQKIEALGAWDVGGHGASGSGDLGVVILEARLKRSGFVHYLYVHNAGPGLKRDESKYVGDKPRQSQWQWSRGEMVRAVLGTVIMGKRCHQKELEMILGSPSPCNPQH